jgi:hypothetical protein
MLDKMETGWGHLGGPVEHSEGKGGESVVAILRFLWGSHYLCRLRTKGLVPVSKYWTYWSCAGVYGPDKPSSWMPTYAWLCPYCFNGLFGRETGCEPVDQSVGMLWIVSGALFLGSSGPAQLCWRLRERLPCTGTTHRKRMSGIHRLEWEAYMSCWLDFPLEGVHRFESPWLGYE